MQPFSNKGTITENPAKNGLTIGVVSSRCPAQSVRECKVGRHMYAQESYLRTSRWHRKYSNSSNDEHRCQTLFARSSKVWTSCPCVRIWPLYCRKPCLGESNGALEINCPSGGSEVCWLTCWVPRMEFYETLLLNEWNVMSYTYIWVSINILFPKLFWCFKCFKKSSYSL